MKKLIYILLMSVCVFTVKSQVTSLYFLENSPTRHYMNPAFQPLSGFYFGMPLFGYGHYNLGNNSITLKNVLSTYEGKTITFLDENGDRNQFYKALRPVTSIDADVQINLLNFGFRVKSAYWTFSITEKMDAQLGLPKDLFNLLLFGMPEIDNNVYSLKTFGVSANTYTEAALGYSKEINEQWTAGAKLKFLAGTANMNASFSELEFNAGIEEWRLKMNGTVNASLPGELVIDENEISNSEFTPHDNFMQFLKPNGVGGAIDLGVTYKPLDFLTLSAAIVDLGLIKWRNNVSNISASSDFMFDGLGYVDGIDLMDTEDFEVFGDSILSALESSLTTQVTSNGYNTYLPAKLNVGAELNLLGNGLTLGLLSRTTRKNKTFYEELTASLNMRPANWFNTSVSYSVLNGRMSNIGLAMGLRVGIFNWFAATDYIPLRYTQPIKVETGWDVKPNFNVYVPYETGRFNFTVGSTIVFGNRRDKDRDGVKDKFDLCPDTPKAARKMVDENGCPKDSDGDGIPDYLDKCPDTPYEARLFVDEHGCPTDSDGDGVLDYLDKCSETPAEAFSSIDEHGCPKDSDGDSIPDYLDKCPETPAEARGFVNEHGCPVDSDNDGIFDYMDKCPNTPQGVTVDEYGCPVDTDGDGVPDYLDKCPDTPAEAHGLVDELGCPKDSDGDGIPDYLDDCPKIAGVAENNGCPEIKKEVRTLFQKALQGIQFETGKDVIRPVSFPILNQIATVMTENPTYLIEIQGHTDSIGSPESNQILSEKRANAVRTYLIGKQISETRMTAKGFGDTVPVAPNKTPQGRALNRRVEFVVSFEEVTFE